MESRIVSAIDCIFSVDIAHHQKSIVALFEKGNLVDGGVRAQTQVPVEVVCVGGFARNVIWRNEQFIEAIEGFHSRTQILKQLKLLAFNDDVRKFVRFVFEKVVSQVDDSCQRVSWVFVQFSLGQIQNSLGNICEVILRIVDRELFVVVGLAQDRAAALPLQSAIS